MVAIAANSHIYTTQLKATKMKLLQTKDYLLLIDEEAEVCRGQHRFLNNKVEPIHEGHNYPYKGNKVIAYYPLNSEAKELDLPLLPNPFEEVDIKKLAENSWEGCDGCNETDEYFWKKGFMFGYNMAQSNKQFSLEDMKKAIKMATYINPSDTSRFYSSEEIIQSLSTQQLPKQFSLEDMIAFGKKCFYKGFDKSENDDANCFTAWKEEANELLQSLSTQQLPKEFVISDMEYLSTNGSWEDVRLPLLKDFVQKANLRYKTITNSECKQELVGVYKY